MSNWLTIEAERARLRRQDLVTRAERERAAGHLDTQERAEVLRAIDDEIQRLSWFRVDAHAYLGLADGALGDGRVPTLVLHAALATLRARLHP